ncbi:MAG: hypothetical protein R3293_07390 [Candidatus Promineifilaceae bacterium]|nr:hypothetical protein [Candidatus Promineifilaceae bacterium]
MDSEIRQLIQDIHDCSSRVVVVVAGAGTQALSDLLGVAGATRTLLEALVPYSEASFDEFLGQKPPQYVADETAHLLAGRAFTRARWLDSEANPQIGLACTATIITDRPKRGEHRAHIATWQPSRLVRYSLHLCKGARDRAGEEDLVSRVILNSLAKACGIDLQISVPFIAEDELETQEHNFAKLVRKLLNKDITHFAISDYGQTTIAGSPPPILLSGSFNPLHNGHLTLAKVASDILGQDVAFELSVINADKPPLPEEAALDRIAQFAGRYPIIAGSAPTFVKKAKLYPGSTFLVGYDTAARILQPRFYGNSYEAMEKAVDEIGKQGCRFLVAGRALNGGEFLQVEDLPIPYRFQKLFQGISPKLFREDVSSTELRRSGRKGSR